MARVRFGAFLPPHHPVGEHPALLFQRDLDFVEHLDRLGFEEVWVGEHHSTGWETISSPEMFLAAASQRTHRIMLGTGVVSLPYHHPFMVAERMVQLDYLCQGRAMFGTGPGALTKDAQMIGLDPLILRDRQEEALTVLIPLLRGETVTRKSAWFTLQEAQLQLLPLQENMEIVAASSVSPSGMKIAGRFGLGALSLATSFNAGSKALSTQWDYAEEAARTYGMQVNRRNWRIVMNFHLAETRKQAEAEAARGYSRWYNDYIIETLTLDGQGRVDDEQELLARLHDPAQAVGRTNVIGTPDDAVAAIRNLMEETGGFGCVLALAHDWADVAATRRSWEMMARYVVPAINGLGAGLRASYEAAVANRVALINPQYAAIKAKMDEAAKSRK
jgi:limonene 1,2-monooxygenase